MLSRLTIVACSSMALFSGLLLAGPAVADDAKAAANSGRISALISALGSPEYSVREAATDELMSIGLPAFASLEAAADHPEREVRYRSQQILGLIRELDLQRRLEAFLSGKDDVDEYALPAWNRFRKAYGDDSQSRQIFVEMQRAEPALLKALEESPRSAADVLGYRAMQHQQAMQNGVHQLALGNVAAMLFIAGEEDVVLPAQTMSMVFNYCHQQSLRDAITGGNRREVPRKMMSALIRRSEDWSAYQAMILAYQYNLSEGIVPAVKILENQANRVPHMSQYALMTVAKMGDQSHLPLIEKLFDDKSIVTRMQEKNAVYDVQVRDAALATALVLTKQDPKDFFPGRADQQWGDPQQIFFNARLIGFENDEKRAEVFKKWAEYRASKKDVSAARP